MSTLHVWKRRQEIPPLSTESLGILPATLQINFFFNYLLSLIYLIFSKASSQPVQEVAFNKVRASRLLNFPDRLSHHCVSGSLFLKKFLSVLSVWYFSASLN